MTRVTKKLLSIVIGVISLFSCSERDHTNIFDPEAGLDSLEVTPNVRQSDSVIVLTWPRAQTVEVKAYNIYRKVGDEISFSKIKSVPNDVFTYTDTNIRIDIPHRYYLTFTGIDNESPPTRSITTTPGPGVFWILDDLNLEIIRLTYDLKFNISTLFAVWYPQSFCWDSRRNYGLVPFTSYHYFEIFDLETSEILHASTRIDKPYDCLYVEEKDEFWISDTSRGIYRVNPQTGSEEFIITTIGKPTWMQYHPAGWVYVLDRQSNSIKKYNISGTLINEYSSAGDNKLIKPVRFHVVTLNQDLYIIDRHEEEDYLIRINSESIECDTLLVMDNMRQVLTNNDGQIIWLSTNQVNEGQLLQLSYDGLRLNEIKGFTYIADFKINPYNKSLVICDYWGDKVVHIRQDGSKIGETKKRIAPHRVYIQ